MKKAISIFLSLVLCLTLCAPAFAMDSLRINEETVYLSTASKGGQYRVTSTESNDTYIIRGYEKDILIEEYVVVPGSAEYIKSLYENSGKASSQKVEMDNVIKIMPAQEFSVGGYMGTMYYNNIQYIYMIDCYINNSVDPTSNWTVQSYYGTIANFIAAIIAALGLPSGIASAVVSSLVSAGIFAIIGQIINQVTTVTLQASVTSHTITGTSTNPIDGSYHSAVLYGKTAVITDLTSNYAGGTFREGYSSADWRTGVFGRAMFKAVYNSDWTPTGWTD